MKKKLLIGLSALLTLGTLTLMAATALAQEDFAASNLIASEAGEEAVTGEDAPPVQRGRRGRALLVDDDGAQCPNAQFTTIQAAVFAANEGARIQVCPGTYPEQVMINKDLRIEGLAVGNDNLVLLSPGAVTPNSTTVVSGAPIAAIIVVDGAKKVDLANLTVDGRNNGLNSCGTNFAGIYYRNASGRIDSVAVRNILLGPGGEGCQTGLGIYVQSAATGTAKLEVRNSSIHDYQKAGIVANEANTELLASGNAITGLGPIFFNTQNGVQFGFGATGKLENNSIINHIFAGCADASCSTISTGVFLFRAGDAKVEKNHIGKNQTGVYVESNDAQVMDNFIFDSDVFNAVAVIGDNNEVARNTLFNSDGGAIALAGNENKVQSNTINEAPTGILEVSGSSRNSKLGNRFFNVDQLMTALTLARLGEREDGGARSMPTVSAVRD